MSSKIYILIALFSLIGIVTACNNGNKIASTEQQNKLEELFVPKELSVFAPFSDYLLDSSKIASSKLKVYVSINFSCPSCLDKLKKWSAIALELSKFKVPIIIIANAEDRFEFFKFLSKQNAIAKFPYPYFFDKKSQFYAKNKVINHSVEQDAVLSTQDNKIILVGDILKIPQQKTNFINKIKQLQKNTL